MLRQSFKLLIIGLGGLAVSAQAEIYKRVDADGRITYSNVQTKDAVRLKIGKPAPKKYTPKASTSKAYQATTKAANLKQQYRSQISANTQSKRDATRREILLDELNQEKNALDEAKKAYDLGKNTPEVVRRRNADGSIATFRNVPKYRAKMEQLTATLKMHERNVDLLQKEIAALN